MTSFLTAIFVSHTDPNTQIKVSADGNGSVKVASFGKTNVSVNGSKCRLSHNVQTGWSVISEGLSGLDISVWADAFRDMADTAPEVGETLGLLIPKERKLDPTTIIANMGSEFKAFTSEMRGLKEQVKTLSEKVEAYADEVIVAQRRVEDKLDNFVIPQVAANAIGGPEFTNAVKDAIISIFSEVKENVESVGVPAAITAVREEHPERPEVIQDLHQLILDPEQGKMVIGPDMGDIDLPDRVEFRNMHTDMILFDKVDTHTSANGAVSGTTYSVRDSRTREISMWNKLWVMSWYGVIKREGHAHCFAVWSRDYKKNQKLFAIQSGANLVPGRAFGADGIMHWTIDYAARPPINEFEWPNGHALLDYEPRGEIAGDDRNGWVWNRAFKQWIEDLSLHPYEPFTYLEEPLTTADDQKGLAKRREYQDSYVSTNVVDHLARHDRVMANAVTKVCTYYAHEGAIFNLAKNVVARKEACIGEIENPEEKAAAERILDINRYAAGLLPSPINALYGQVNRNSTNAAIDRRLKIMYVVEPKSGNSMPVCPDCGLVFPKGMYRKICETVSRAATGVVAFGDGITMTNSFSRLPARAPMDGLTLSETEVNEKRWALDRRMAIVDGIVKIRVGYDMPQIRERRE